MHVQKAISLDTYNRAGMVSEPLNMFDVAPSADGAAAFVITSYSIHYTKLYDYATNPGHSKSSQPVHILELLQPALGPNDLP